MIIISTKKRPRMDIAVVGGLEPPTCRLDLLCTFAFSDLLCTFAFSHLPLYQLSYTTKCPAVTRWDDVILYTGLPPPPKEPLPRCLPV